jgi:hypothetical protein
MLSNSALECMRDVRYVLRVREIFQSFTLLLPVLLLLQISHPGPTAVLITRISKPPSCPFPSSLSLPEF